MRVLSSVVTAAAFLAVAVPGIAQTGSMSGMSMPTCPASSPVVWENTKTHVFSTRSQVGFGAMPGRAVCRSTAVKAGYRPALSTTSRSLGAGSYTPGGGPVPNADTRARQPGAGSTMNNSATVPSTNSGSDSAASQPQNGANQSGSNAPLSAPGSMSSSMPMAPGTPLPQATGNTSIGQPAPVQAPNGSPSPH